LGLGKSESRADIAAGGLAFAVNVQTCADEDPHSIDQHTSMQQGLPFLCARENKQDDPTRSIQRTGKERPFASLVLAEIFGTLPLVSTRFAPSGPKCTSSHADKPEIR